MVGVLNQMVLEYGGAGVLNQIVSEYVGAGVLNQIVSEHGWGTESDGIRVWLGF